MLSNNTIDQVTGILLSDDRLDPCELESVFELFENEELYEAVKIKLTAQNSDTLSEYADKLIKSFIGKKLIIWVDEFLLQLAENPPVLIEPYITKVLFLFDEYPLLFLGKKDFERRLAILRKHGHQINYKRGKKILTSRRRAATATNLDKSVGQAILAGCDHRDLSKYDKERFVQAAKTCGTRQEEEDSKRITEEIYKNNQRLQHLIEGNERVTVHREIIID